MNVKTSSLEMQATLYLFDLQNLAAERGRMANNDWQIQRVTIEEKIALEKHYRFTLSKKVLAAELPLLFELVCQKLNIGRTDKNEGSLANVAQSDANYLIAFNKEHLR